MADGGTPPAPPIPGLPVAPAGTCARRRPAGTPAPTPAHGRQPGIREVLLVAAAVVLTVFVAAAATALLPREGQAVVFDTPLLIFVLIFGTAIVLWRILRSPRT